MQHLLPWLFCSQMSCSSAVSLKKQATQKPLQTYRLQSWQGLETRCQETKSFKVSLDHSVCFQSAHHAPSTKPTAKCSLLYLNLFFEFKNKFSSSLPLALGLKHTLLIGENPLRWFRCWGLLVCWLFCHLFEEDVVAWIWIAQNAVGILGFAKSLFKSKGRRPKRRHYFRFRLPGRSLSWAHSSPTVCKSSLHPTPYRPTCGSMHGSPAVWHPARCWSAVPWWQCVAARGRHRVPEQRNCHPPRWWLHLPLLLERRFSHLNSEKKEGQIQLLQSVTQSGGQRKFPSLENQALLWSYFIKGNCYI